jgi:pantoate--beta-alanine ligase
MNIVTKLDDWLAIRKQLSHASIGFVHTMGNLHAGHMSLCRQSKDENDITVAAIFVNPAQFNDVRDFELYPRTLEQDIALLSEQGVDYLLLFEYEILYPDDYQLQVSETETSTVLEGQYRPGHFTGMLTIVLKFLNIVQPTRSYYGEKDYQQWLLIRKMAQALFLSVEIVACPTIRAEDKLALSSRNARLSPAQRKMAAHFPALLHSDFTVEYIVSKLQELGFKVDYIEDKWQRRLGAVWVAEVRLIDNFPGG